MIRRITTGEYQRCLEPELVDEVRALKEADPLDPVAIAVPTNALGLHLSRYIAREIGGHAEIRALTLLDLARRLGEESLSRGGLSALPPLADMLMLRQVIETSLSASERSYFGRVAETAGFLRVLLSAVGDLKEACVTPAEIERALPEAGLRGPAVGKIKEVIALWRAYERRKSDARFYDRADLMRAGASAAAASPWLAGIRRLLFYGFYDLNPLQRLLVERCAEAVDTIFFFPFVDTPAYDFARPTLQWLRSIGFEPAAGRPRPDAAKRGLAAEAPAGLEMLRGGLFARFSGSGELPEAGRSESRGPQGAGSHEGVAVISAAGEENECREIVREVLRLAGLGGDAREPSDGELRFNEFAVLLMDPSKYVAPMCEIMHGLGVEPYVREGLPLSRTRAGRSLALLAELLESDLSRRAVMDFLTFAELNVEGVRAACGEASQRSMNPALWDHLSRDLGIVQGIDEWRARLSACVGSEARSGDDAPQAAGGGESGSPREKAVAREAAGVLLALLDYLSAASASLRSSDLPGRFAERVSSIYGALVAPGTERDLVLEALAQLAALDSCSGSIDPPLFFWLMRRHLEQAQTRLGSLRGAGPVVAGLMAARGLPFKVVALPGLTEGLFPAVARQDPILLDGERRALNAAMAKVGAGGRLSLKSERLKEDRLLFRLAAGAASRLLLLSYSRVDPSSGAERLPSEFIMDASTALTGERCDLGSLGRLPFHRRVPLAALFPEDGSFIDGAEYNLMAADMAVGGDTAALKYLEDGDTFFKKALEGERRRWDEFRLTPHDGAMESPAALGELRGRFAGPRGAVSPTSIETYCDCPFLYFMRYILKIEAVEDPEEILAIPPRDLGSLAHAILERSLGAIFSRRNGPAGSWESTLLSVASELIGAYRRRSPHGLPLLREIDERRLVRNLLYATAKDIDDLGGFLPWKLEVRYGSPEENGGRGGPEISIGSGRRLALSGKIDRVDLDRSRGTARVIDYKTGKGSNLKDNRLSGGTALQLPLYVLGAQHMLGDEARVVDAQYYFVSGDRTVERCHFTAEAVAERMRDLVSILGTAARGVERGLFFAYPGDSCRYCEYRTACAPAQGLFERKSTDPRIQEFLRMKEIE